MISPVSHRASSDEAAINPMSSGMQVRPSGDTALVAFATCSEVSMALRYAANAYCCDASRSVHKCTECSPGAYGTSCHRANWRPRVHGDHSSRVCYLDIGTALTQRIVNAQRSCLRKGTLFAYWDYDCAAIFAGRYSDDLTKGVGKVRMAGKSAIECDVDQRV